MSEKEPFENANFIESSIKYNKDFTGKNYVPLLRRRFKLYGATRVLLRVCALGYGYFYINGKKVTQDLFTSPVSNYNKTLWYNEYDITALLNDGENVFSAILGNGWYNEEFESPWKINEAPWRGAPKMIAELEANGKIIFSTDNSFLCDICAAYIFNALRSGEYFDSRLYNEKWNEKDFDDSSWGRARISEKIPTGKFRKCECEPIRECEEIQPVKIQKTGKERYVFDMGKNISGYVRLFTAGESGQLLTIRYAEQLNENGEPELNAMDTYYKGGNLFQTDRFICSGKSFVWAPKFSYYGFRYVEIDGIKNEKAIKVCGVFVHQNISRRTEFYCSDKFLNKLFEAGIRSSYSNMFYMLTDCPTREKLGWTNDARASCEQLYINFEADAFFSKWLQDIYDAQRPDGCLPCVVPSAGWGYEWGNGPVSDGILFEIPYMSYLYENNETMLKNSLPYFKKYLEYINTKRDADGFVRFGLDDWANPGSRPEFKKEFKGFGLDTQKKKVPVEFINAVLICRFCDIARLSCKLSGRDDSFFKEIFEDEKKRINRSFITKDKESKIDAQTAVSMLIVSKLGGELPKLCKQLKRLIEENNYHHDCGMVGMRYIFEALDRCDLNEYAYKIITADGYPSYKDWFDNGATTLWETWDVLKHNDSKNHHMYSCVLTYLINVATGIQKDFGCLKHEKYVIRPYFYKQLKSCRGKRSTKKGSISISWVRENRGIKVQIQIEGEVCATYMEKSLNRGTHVFFVSES